MKKSERITSAPEALYASNLLLDQLELAVDALSEEQREVLVPRALAGRSFKEMAVETGVSVNTLLSRRLLCGTASARAIATHLRRMYESMRH